MGEAARTDAAEQPGVDGGWGLTLTSVSSLVNTSEVLPILQAASIAGQPVRQGLDFLTGAIPEHSRPRPEGGRGEHTRFIAFGLAGLLSHPRFFHHHGVAETAAWCVGWPEDHQVDDGWPEVLGLDDTSLHQTPWWCTGSPNSEMPSMTSAGRESALIPRGAFIGLGCGGVGVLRLRGGGRLLPEFGAGEEVSPSVMCCRSGG